MKLKHYVTRKKSIFLSSLLAYIILLSVPIVIGFGIYTQSIIIINSEVNRANDAILKQVQTSLDSRLREVEQLAVRIGLDSRINGLLSVKENVQVTHRYTMHEIINDFRAYIVANQFINSFYIYMENSDIAIASNATYYSRVLVATWHGAGEDKYVQWTNLIESVQKEQYLLLDKITSQGVIDKSLSYMHPLPIGSPKNSSAMLVIFLNTDILREVVSGIKMINQGVVMVMNKDGEILFSTDPSYALPDTLGYDAVSQGTDTIPAKIGGQDVTISHINSTVADWVYITSVPTEVFLEEALNARRLALISLVACMLLGGALVFYFIRMNYNPVRELIGAITRKSGVSMHKGFNEYGFIQDVVSKIIDEKESIQRRLDQQDLNLKNYHFARVLKGNADNIPFDSTCQYYRLDFKSDHFAVMLFYIKDYNRQLWEDGSAASQTIYAVLRNAVEELVSRYEHVGLMVEVDNFYACLVNMRDERDHKEDLIKIAGEAMEFIGGNFGLNFSVSISGSMKSFSGIPILYQQAMETIEYLLFIGKNRILHYDEIKAKKDDLFSHRSFIMEEQRFVNCLKAGDYEKVKQVFNEIIVTNFQSDTAMPIELVKCRMFGLVNTMINNMSELSVLYESRFFQKVKPVERLLNCHSIQELQQCFNELLDEVGRLDSGKAGFDPGLVDKVKDHIRLNYQDVNLNVSALAEQYGTTTAYLSKLFKKRTGMGLLDYIHRCRLERTKELLGNKQIIIRDISQMTGFINSDAFIRVFKKYEGITPGKYRENILKDVQRQKIKTGKK